MRAVWAPALVVLVAAGLRLWQINLTHYAWEPALFVRQAAEFLDSGRVPEFAGRGFTAGFRQPPLYLFMLTPPMLVSRDPVWLSAAQAALDAIGALFVFLAARDLAGRWAGIAAGLLYAVAPAAVVYSRFIWNPNPVLFLSAIALWGAIGFARFGDGRRLGSGVFAAGCAVQLHPRAARRSAGSPS